MPATTSMRLDEETKRLIDQLCERLAIKSKAAIVKLAVRRMARAEGVELSKEKRKPGRPKE